MERIIRDSLAALAFALALGTATYGFGADATGCTPQERSNQTLSETLDQTKGVICPPDVDPAMKAPTPKTGDTPVIPPPGSYGGDPNVPPK
jgi:hypothetical protein